MNCCAAYTGSGSSLSAMNDGTGSITISSSLAVGGGVTTDGGASLGGCRSGGGVATGWEWSNGLPVFERGGSRVTRLARSSVSASLTARRSRHSVCHRVKLRRLFVQWWQDRSVGDRERVMCGIGDGLSIFTSGSKTHRTIARTATQIRWPSTVMMATKIKRKNRASITPSLMSLCNLCVRCVSEVDFFKFL